MGCGRGLGTLKETINAKGFKKKMKLEGEGARGSARKRISGEWEVINQRRYLLEEGFAMPLQSQKRTLDMGNGFEGEARG